MNSHRQRARRKTVTWQVSSLVLLAAAVGAGAAPLARLLGPGEGGPLKVTIDKPPEGPRLEGLATGYVLVTKQSMDAIAGKVDVTQLAAETPEAEPETPVVDETPHVPQLANAAWTYVGRIQGPARTVAIVSVLSGSGEARQVAISEGTEYEGTKLTQVHPDHIMVESGGLERRIDLAPRTAAVMWDSGAPRRPGAPRPGVPNAGLHNGAQPPGFNPTSPAAAAEARRRMNAAIAPPNPALAAQQQAQIQEQRQEQMLRMAKEMGALTPEQRDTLSKVLSEPGLGDEERRNLLSEFGLPPDASPEEQQQFFQLRGVAPDTDPKLFEMLRQGGVAK